MEMALWAMMGWCGTKWPGWWQVPPKPQPDPWWWFVSIAGAVGGAVAVTVFRPVLGDVGFFASAATAFAGGVFLGSVVDGIRSIASRGG